MYIYVYIYMHIYALYIYIHIKSQYIPPSHGGLANGNSNSSSASLGVHFQRPFNGPKSSMISVGSKTSNWAWLEAPQKLTYKCYNGLW